MKAGRAIALFDGVDEIFDPAMREQVLRDIHRFTNEYPQVRTIVTSRWLGYKIQQLRDAGFQHFMLQDLESEQIQTFIDKWHELTFSPGADKQLKQARLEKAIRENYPDRPEILDLLRDRSANDSDEKVREFAKEQLAIWQTRKS